MAKSDTHYFYVLECKDGTYYGGYTTDVARVKQNTTLEFVASTHEIGVPSELFTPNVLKQDPKPRKPKPPLKKLLRKDKDLYLQKNKGGDMR